MKAGIPIDKMEAKKLLRFSAADLEETEAAVHLQQMFRRRQARIKLKELIKGAYSRSYDERRKSFFYTNNKTGESFGKNQLLPMMQMILS